MLGLSGGIGMLITFWVNIEGALMAEYQNIFTQVQVQGPPELGVEEGVNLDERTRNTSFHLTRLVW